MWEELKEFIERWARKWGIHFPTTSDTLPTPETQSHSLDVGEGNVTTAYRDYTVAKTVILLAGDQGADDPAPVTVTHYAAPTTAGAADGSSESDPFLISSFWAVAQPGDHLQLANGTYTGINSMIQPSTGLSGTSNARIKISAKNDGSVSIDGQGTNTPIVLDIGNDYFTIEGVNAYDSDHNVVTIKGDYNIVRRGVFWDAVVNENVGVVRVSDGTGNLVEDCAAFGKGRVIFRDSQFSTGTTFRRLWAMGNNNQYSGGSLVTMSYQSHDAIGENIIVTYDRDAASLYPPRGLLTFGRIDKPTPPDYCGNSKYFGCICYSLSEQVHTGREQMLDAGNTAGEQGCLTYQDILTFEENGRRTAALRNTTFTSYYTNATEIGNGSASGINAAWTVTNRTEGATLGDVESPWQTTAGTGARVYYRYVDGTLTSTPLWPWPMDARIRAGLTAAGRDPDTIFRGTGNSVTDLMENLFGTIPGI